VSLVFTAAWCLPSRAPGTSPMLLRSGWPV